jgi:hypothetical protein
MRTYGVEIEYVNMDRRTVADQVAQALGVAHIHVLPYHGTVCEVCQARVSGYTEWKVERDGSVYSGGEVISPILQGEDGFVQIKKVMKAIKEVLAQPEQEPDDLTIAYMSGFHDGKNKDAPQREWVGLTDKEYEAMAEQYVTNYYFDTLKYARAIEAKLKENNN